MDETFSNVAPHLRHLLKDMLQHLELKDRRYFGRMYRTCFKGKAAVKFMLNGRHANDITHAEDLGNELMSAGVLEHVCQSHPFRNKSLFYRFSFCRSIVAMEKDLDEEWKL
ncbi:hypothetical protein BSKO_10181 [Bryopsis sp. KO-2023]|nr:hypothetical protein BSKO_10181 [Bryopsis sp. KO-2023]